MQRPTRDAIGLMLALVSAAPLGAQAVRQVSERPVRSWSEEMRDKAEHSMYVDGDCHRALQRADAAFVRANRHPESMDPRITQVRARALACEGRTAEAVPMFVWTDDLAGADPRNDAELAAACEDLFAGTMPENRDSARAALTVEWNQLQKEWARTEPERLAAARSSLNVQTPSRRTTWSVGRYGPGYPSITGINPGTAKRARDDFVRTGGPNPGLVDAYDALLANPDPEEITRQMLHVAARLTCLDPAD